MFLILYLMSFLLVLNSDDWFIIWLGLELNMFSFILLSFKQISMNYIESCLKYFFVQSLGSALLLFSFYLNNIGFVYMIMMIMTYKMGAGIFFFWFPSVCSMLGWWACFFLMTFQKIIPLMISVFFMSWIVWLMVVVSLIIGAWGSLNQKQLKVLLAFSSIHHVGWMLMSIMMDVSLWMFYLMMYSMMIIPIVFLLSEKVIIDLMEINKWGNKFWFMLMMLSMGGMPPMLGFFLKWILFYYVIGLSFSMFVFMVLMSVLMFYIYIRIVYDIMMNGVDKFSWSFKKNMKLYFLKMDLISIIGFIMGMLGGVLLVV